MDIERTIRNVQRNSVIVEDPRKSAFIVLKTATEFYDAEWSGIIDADIEMKIWTPFWWYHADKGEMAQLCFPENGGTYDSFDRWMESITLHKPMVIPDIEQLKDDFPEEYKLYKGAGVNSILAVPYWQRPMGFFLLKNPKRYKKYTSMLHLLNYTVITSLHEYKMRETLRHRTVSPRIESEKDVYICVFGTLKITTSKGSITESDLKSPKIVRLVVYLLLSRKSAIAPREIQDAIWPDEDCDFPGKNIKGLVYRFQQAFSVISEYRLIESTTNGYRINTNLNITTDIQLFANKYQLALTSSYTEEKKELLQKALALYEGDVLISASSEHWLMATVVSYQYYYIGIFNELMHLFEAERYYEGIHSYAAKALLIMPGNPDIYFWMIHALAKKGNCEIVRSELKLAESALVEDDFQDLKERLSADISFGNQNYAFVVNGVNYI